MKKKASPQKHTYAYTNICKMLEQNNFTTGIRAGYSWKWIYLQLSQFSKPRLREHTIINSTFNMKWSGTVRTITAMLRQCIKNKLLLNLTSIANYNHTFLRWRVHNKICNWQNFSSTLFHFLNRSRVWNFIRVLETIKNLLEGIGVKCSMNDLWV